MTMSYSMLRFVLPFCSECCEGCDMGSLEYRRVRFAQEFFFLTRCSHWYCLHQVRHTSSMNSADQLSLIGQWHGHILLKWLLNKQYNWRCCDRWNQSTEPHVLLRARYNTQLSILGDKILIAKMITFLLHLLRWNYFCLSWYICLGTKPPSFVC